jgi:hypothetical protein
MGKSFIGKKRKPLICEQIASKPLNNNNSKTTSEHRGDVNEARPARAAAGSSQS